MHLFPGRSLGAYGRDARGGKLGALRPADVSYNWELGEITPGPWADLQGGNRQLSSALCQVFISEAVLAGSAFCPLSRQPLDLGGWNIRPSRPSFQAGPFDKQVLELTNSLLSAYYDMEVNLNPQHHFRVLSAAVRLVPEAWGEAACALAQPVWLVGYDNVEVNIIPTGLHDRCKPGPAATSQMDHLSAGA